MCSKRSSFNGFCEKLSIVLSKNGNSLGSNVSLLTTLAYELMNPMAPTPSDKGWEKETPIVKPMNVCKKVLYNLG